MTLPSRAIFCVCAASAFLYASPGSTAAREDLAEAQKRYQQERSECMKIQSPENRSTCLREARAALQAAKQGKLDDPPAAELQRNRLARCDPLPPADRQACVRLETMSSGLAPTSIRGLATPVFASEGDSATGASGSKAE
jgi:hypothetical protein